MTDTLPASDSKIPGLGARIRSARQSKGWSQEELAERVKKTKGSVSQWELDIATPGLAGIVLVARELEVSVKWLLGDDPADLKQHRHAQIQVSGYELVTRLTTALSAGQLAPRQIHLMADLLHEFTAVDAS